MGNNPPSPCFPFLPLKTQFISTRYNHLKEMNSLKSNYFLSINKKEPFKKTQQCRAHTCQRSVENVASSAGRVPTSISLNLSSRRQGLCWREPGWQGPFCQRCHPCGEKVGTRRHPPT